MNPKARPRVLSTKAKGYNKKELEWPNIRVIILVFFSKSIWLTKKINSIQLTREAPNSRPKLRSSRVRVDQVVHKKRAS